MRINIKSYILKGLKNEFVKIVIFIFLLIFQIRYGIIPAWNEIHSDFPNYYTSSRLLLEGNNISNIYNDSWFQREINNYGITGQGKFSPFPPPTAFVMIPIAMLDPITAKRVFLIFNIILIMYAAFLIKKISDLSYICACNIILLSGAALINDLVFGQFYLILLTMILSGYMLLLRKNGNSTGVLWGIGAAVKYFPVIYLPAIIIKKEWKVLASMIITILFVNIITCIILGADVYVQFFQKVFFSHLNGELSSQSKYAVSFQSWNSFLRNIFVYDRLENPSPLFNSLMAFYIIRVIVYFVFLSAVIIALYRLRKHGNFTTYSIIILTLVAFVLSPASASYHLLLLVLPVILLLKLGAGMRPVYSTFFIVLYTVIGISPFLLSRMNKEAVGLFIAYSRLWLMVIFFASSVWFIFLHSGMKYFEVHNFRSTTPNAKSSSLEL